MSFNLIIKYQIKKVIASGIYYSGLLKLLNLKNHNIILGYHRVLPKGHEITEFIQPAMYVTEETFEQHLKYLKNNYDIITFDELIDINSIKNKCIITFDDGWFDNYEFAFPLLKKYNVNATIFLSTNFINTHQWPWPDRISYYIHNLEDKEFLELKNFISKYIKNSIQSDKFSLKLCKGLRSEFLISLIKTIKFENIQMLMDEIDQNMSTLLSKLATSRTWLNWDEIKEMKSNGIQFAPHTHNHVILTTASLTVAQKEVKQSINVIAKKLNIKPKLFSYPNGNFNQKIIELLIENQVQFGVSTRPGFMENSPSNLLLNRFLIHNDVTKNIPMFACKVSNIFAFR